MKKAVSAGGIIIKKENGQNKILLLTYPKSDLLRFPKGHVEPGEILEQTAMREVCEETGLKNTKIIKKLGMLTRKSTEDSGEEVIKNIHMFIMTTKDYDHKSSDSTYTWIPIEQAIDHMYFLEENEFLKRHLNEILDNG